MANPIIELDPVTHITAGAVGQPGHRTFFIQAERRADRVDLVCEKEQVQALADAIDEMAQNLEQEFGLTRPADVAVDDAAMAIKEPLDPLFRVGAMGLGYDANRDRILLVAQEALGEDEERDPREARFFATRDQMEALSRHAREVISHGRSPEKVALQAEAHTRRNGHGD
jgi:uncharacterized repeat protein (TIGR03847 family)